jgi:hypothetical protein
VLARIRDDGAVSLPDALTIAASAPAERIAQRFAAALRIRTLHGTVLRRTRTLAARGELPPELPHSDPLDAAAPIRSSPSPSANASASSARSASRPRRARSTPVTSTAW